MKPSGIRSLLIPYGFMFPMSHARLQKLAMAGIDITDVAQTGIQAGVEQSGEGPETARSEAMDRLAADHEPLLLWVESQWQELEGA